MSILISMVAIVIFALLCVNTARRGKAIAVSDEKRILEGSKKMVLSKPNKNPYGPIMTNRQLRKNLMKVEYIQPDAHTKLVFKDNVIPNVLIRNIEKAVEKMYELQELEIWKNPDEFAPAFDRFQPISSFHNLIILYNQIASYNFSPFFAEISRINSDCYHLEDHYISGSASYMTKLEELTNRNHEIVDEMNSHIPAKFEEIVESFANYVDNIKQLDTNWHKAKIKMTQKRTDADFRDVSADIEALNRETALTGYTIQRFEN